MFFLSQGAAQMTKDEGSKMQAYKTYGVAVTIENQTYNFHVSSEEGVRGIFDSILAPVEDFSIIEEIGRSHRELGFTEIVQMLRRADAHAEA